MSKMGPNMSPNPRPNKSNPPHIFICYLNNFLKRICSRGVSFDFVERDLKGEGGGEGEEGEEGKGEEGEEGGGEGGIYEIE